MNVIFRADASLEIGLGHVMRCLTLADELTRMGAECQFICQEVDGHMLSAIEAKGFVAKALPGADQDIMSWQEDCERTWRLVSKDSADWLVVDHYALDHKWERELRRQGMKLMAIDDLANRPHFCDLLLDQNLGREVGAYAALVPDECTILTGPRYALLRPQFAEQRAQSLERREHGAIEQLLVSMGGVDQPNATGAVLMALKDSDLPPECHIKVVMGLASPWLDNVREIAATLPWSVDICVDVQDMAALMVQSDLAIGAGGGTSWERCCMGLPTLIVVIADNQQEGALALVEAGAVFQAGSVSSENFDLDLKTFISKLAFDVDAVRQLSAASAAICDGKGVSRVAQMLHGGMDQ
ncbi:MAG: UDP-2,4-diacetamido-2,4,6-trideoxy-beta-L-altropyranose hydrolase [Rhodobiaceae bacterium]|nr:UDP-2,4-diacetamido-2,4,6-trideoxy-beta-L-altropyranose hydrolase [Rhodobiaceae bacterium]